MPPLQFALPTGRIEDVLRVPSRGDLRDPCALPRNSEFACIQGPQVAVSELNADWNARSEVVTEKFHWHVNSDACLENACKSSFETCPDLAQPLKLEPHAPAFAVDSIPRQLADLRRGANEFAFHGVSFKLGTFRHHDFPP